VDLDLLAQALEGEPAYRLGQVWRWAAGGAASFAEMTNLPAALRLRLAESVPFSSLTVETETLARDGTLKVLFRTSDGHPLESVLMRFADGRRSVCLSSQSGCPLTCSFCATGRMRFARNLGPGEILDQALHFRRLEPIDHVVFMGMGEPMLNLDAVLAAARRLPDMGVTHRRTTISTVGWLPGLQRFSDEVEEPIRLALSLHAADERLRSRLMPVNDRYSIDQVLAQCSAYVARRGRRVFVEYVLLAGVNDAPAQARDLAALLDPKLFKVNLIPYNPTGSLFEGAQLEPSSREAIARFKAVLDRARLPATVRLTRGRDIAAACGQLAADESARRPDAIPRRSAAEPARLRPAARRRVARGRKPT
jgi:23S rRNA (adenine2503-C2)-methyltransferase